MTDFSNQIQNLYQQDLLPKTHKNYLTSIQSLNPKVIYDIGSCVLHWTRVAKAVWPKANIICFDAIEEVRYLYKDYSYYAYVLSDADNVKKTFYKSLYHIGGQSLYRENDVINSASAPYFTSKSEIKVTTITLDSVVKLHNLPLPDLIKIDVQGSELDVIKGAKQTIASCPDIILELQEIDFNIGAPKAQEVIDYMTSIGYSCVSQKFSQNKFDADYHFRKTI